jgi:purine-binding chemotaxis protein CheW
MERITSQSSVFNLDIQGRNTGYLTTFAFVRGQYGLRISVVGCLELNSVEDPNEFVVGFTEIRGDVVAVIDPRAMFNLGSTPLEGQTCIVLIEPLIDGNKIKLGVLVEDISEVLNIASHNMGSARMSENEPGSVNIDFILKLGKQANSRNLLSKIDEVLSRYNVPHSSYIQSQLSTKN